MKKSKRKQPEGIALGLFSRRCGPLKQLAVADAADIPLPGGSIAVGVAGVGVRVVVGIVVRQHIVNNVVHTVFHIVYAVLDVLEMDDLQIWGNLSKIRPPLVTMAKRAAALHITLL